VGAGFGPHWLNGTTRDAKEMAAIYASSHDPLIFDSNGW
jgi:hypothetical protein